MTECYYRSRFVGWAGEKPIEWAQVEGSGMTYGNNSTTPFVSGHTRATCVTVLLLLNVALGAVAAGSDFAQIRLLERAKAGEEVTEAEAEANDDRQIAIGLVQMGLFVITAIAFIVWMHRAYRNLHAFRVEGRQYSSGWAIGGWFVPFLNLVRPFQVVREIWNGSECLTAFGERFVLLRTPMLVGWWWAMFLISSVAGNLAARLAIRGEDALTALTTQSWAWLISDVLDIPAAILAILVVRGINARQEETHQQLSAGEIGTALH
jgi:hypothetical protein